MPRTKPAAADGRHIADRLDAARHTGFIGRRAEIALFRSALAADRPPFAVLHVYGPAGVGKSTLLGEFARIAREAGRAVVILDGRDIEPARPTLLRAVDEAAGGAHARGVQDTAVADGAVVLIDTYESLSSLDTWLRETVLPAWPARTLVVLAGREAPALAWTTDIAWAPLTRVLRLGNFAPGESRAFLQARAVPPAVQEKALDFTHGHPLALALVSDLLAARTEVSDFDPVEAPDVVRHLSSLLLTTVPDARCREALEICAVARVTRHSLLTSLMGEADGGAAFEWLRQQSFVQSGPLGLFPHDLVREVILAEARWRDAAALDSLSRRIYGALHAQIGTARGHQRQRLQMDALYVTRTRPTNAGFFKWNALDDARTEPAADGDAAWILDVVTRHEGPASAELAAKWWRAQPAAFQVFRGADDARLGFLALLDIGGPAAADVGDPAIARARAFVEKIGPADRGEGVVHLRWWMHADAYQAVTAAINLTAMHVVSHCLTRPDIAWNFVTMAEPAFWSAHFAGVNFPRVPEADFEVGGRHYGVFAHDWRIEPPADWMMGARTPMPFAPGAAGGNATPPLGEADFREAVREALRDFTRPDALAGGRLRSSRLVQGARDGEARAATLQGLLREAVESLLSNPRDRKLHRAVWHTYFEPLATQEQVAERLDLPFSTYRHHLARGIDRIAEWLWRRERSAPPN